MGNKVREVLKSYFLCKASIIKGLSFLVSGRGAMEGRGEDTGPPDLLEHLLVSGAWGLGVDRAERGLGPRGSCSTAPRST